ncbi:hypothetical protein [Amycolatopsis saalfeldensis]|uniref:LPXTG-motif cell wall anchor domain-containing protein n=1 Tax=Amycolatopsis saalfeldensis TaxID=394193 RepID=A0A1H8XHE7_9PSEU|nr:hypothetical protein [Amycolatopsis saalfeldensis]SEP39269.1 hypothetical protein SAMN04489732_107249 [Amycolatopsis saalfeldensis]
MGEICRKFFCGLAALAAAVAALVPGTASAAEWVSPPSSADLAAAVTAAGQPRAISFARSNFRQVDHAKPGRIALAGRGIPVYTLNPGFVAGAAGAPAGVLGSIAVTATTDSGVKATLRASRDSSAPGGWVVANVLSGNDEEALSGKLRPGSVLLNEPQINGWYDLSPAGVVLLQASLPQSPVGQFVPLPDYQRAVHDRYADKLPGSDYQHRGGIGFAPTAARADAGPSVPIVAGLVVLGAAALVVVVVVLRGKRPRAKSR